MVWLALRAAAFRGDRRQIGLSGCRQRACAAHALWRVASLQSKRRSATNTRGIRPLRVDCGTPEQSSWSFNENSWIIICILFIGLIPMTNAPEIGAISRLHFPTTVSGTCVMLIWTGFVWCHILAPIRTLFYSKPESGVQCTWLKWWFMIGRW